MGNDVVVMERERVRERAGRRVSERDAHGVQCFGKSGLTSRCSWCSLSL